MFLQNEGGTVSSEVKERTNDLNDRSALAGRSFKWVLDLWMLSLVNDVLLKNSYFSYFYHCF
ncbi:hypothetical protein DCC39_15360 [Pueribacillus theae]|uniref:Uncharacterized protein n=1 Tax=Pueribacillus theae TaxID=2171751 RepID=A0A2U1JSL7_9BACI|nr:hypothetical protein DCC39_15360 [Pueribacillus theae]